MINGVVVSVSAGRAHAVAITGEGRLYSWGSGTYGQQGHGDTKNRSLPTKQNKRQCNCLTVKQIATGYACTLVIDANDAIWMTGWLCPGGRSSTSFTRIQFPNTPGQTPLRFVQISCTSLHAVAVTTDGGLFSWGLGRHGALGHNSTEDINAPRKMQALKDVLVSSAAAGAKTSVVVARSGEVWSWGTGPALGHGGNEDSQQLLPKVI